MSRRKRWTPSTTEEDLAFGAARRFHEYWTQFLFKTQNQNGPLESTTMIPKRAHVLLMILITAAMEAAASKSVCYTKYGCFSNEPPFERFAVRLPKSPESIGTTFRLFTREQRTKEHILDDSDLNKLSSSNFNNTRRTIIIIHGFIENSFFPWINRLRHALLDREDINLITTDWGNGAWLPYGQAVGNTRLVGAQVAELIKFLIKNAHTSEDLFYIVGFSLGAHIAGYAGTRVRIANQPIGRITGLDPAGPSFANEHIDVTLDPTDAQFVDVIHTDANLLGLPQKLGHIDFYVNGGSTQPKGCTDIPIAGPAAGWTSVCDHLRCPDYYTESVRSQCPWYAYPCENEEDFERGRCFKCNGDCPQMGYNAKSIKGKIAGKHILLTNRSPPFCSYHYLVTFKTGNGWFAALSAQVIIKIYGSDGDTGDVYLERRTFGTGSDESFVALSRKDLGVLREIAVRFQGLNFFQQWHLVSVVVKPGWKNQGYTACYNSWLQPSGGTRDLQKGYKLCLTSAQK